MMQGRAGDHRAVGNEVVARFLYGARNTETGTCPARGPGQVSFLGSPPRFTEHGNRRKPRQDAGARVILAVSENDPISGVMLGVPFRRPEF